MLHLLITSCRSRSIPVDCVSFAAHKRHVALFCDSDFAVPSGLPAEGCHREQYAATETRAWGVEVQRELHPGRCWCLLTGAPLALAELRKRSDGSLGGDGMARRSCGRPAGGMAAGAGCRVGSVAQLTHRPNDECHPGQHFQGGVWRTAYTGPRSRSLVFRWACCTWICRWALSRWRPRTAQQTALVDH